MANKVELYNNGTLIGTDNAPTVNGLNWTYSIPYTADSGNDVLTAKAFVDDVEVASSGVRNVVVNEGGEIIGALTVSSTNNLFSSAQYKAGSQVFGSQLYYPTIYFTNGKTTFVNKESSSDRILITELTPYGLRPPHIIRGTSLNDHDYHDNPSIYWENDRFYIIQEDDHGSSPTAYHKAAALNDTLIINSNAGTIGGTAALLDLAYPLIYRKEGKIIVIGRYDYTGTGNTYNAGYKVADSIEGSWDDFRLIMPKPAGANRRYQSAISNNSYSEDIIFCSSARNDTGNVWFVFNAIKAKIQPDNSMHYYTIDGRLVSEGTMTLAQAQMTEIYNTGSPSVDAMQPVIDIDQNENFYAIHKDGIGNYKISIWKSTETTPTTKTITLPGSPTLLENASTQQHGIVELIPNAIDDIHIFANVNNGTRKIVKEYKSLDEGLTWEFIQDIDFGVDIDSFKATQNRSEISDDTNFLIIGASSQDLTTSPVNLVAKTVAFGSIQPTTNIYSSITPITEAANNSTALFGMKIEAGKINNTGTTLNSIVNQATGATVNALGSPILDNGTTPTFVTFDGVNDAISLSPTILPSDSAILFIAVVADPVSDAAVFSISNNTTATGFVNPTLNSGGRNKITYNARYQDTTTTMVDGDTPLSAGYNVVAWLFRGAQHDVPMWVNGKMQLRNIITGPMPLEGSYTLPSGNTNLEIGRLVRTSIAYYGMKMKYAYIHNVTSEQEILERIKYAADFAGITLQNAYR